MSDTKHIQVADWLYDDYVELQSDPTFEAEQLILDIVVQIGSALEEKDVTQEKLAEQLDISPSALSQLLSGQQNVSLKRLVKVAMALGMRWEVPKLVPFESPEIVCVETTVPTAVELEVESLFKGFTMRSASWGQNPPQPTRLSVEGEPVDEGINNDEELVAA